MLLRTAAFLALASTGAILTAGCSTGDDSSASSPTDEEPLTSVSTADVKAAQAYPITGFTYDHLTPASTKIMHAARWWMTVQDQDARYPKARMCASNVSKVLFLAGITNVDQEGVRNLVAAENHAGAKSLIMSTNKAKWIAQVNTLSKGALPAGTLIAGLNATSSNPGDQHIGFVGHEDPDGTVWVYHNNWYRPENEGGKRKPYMVSEANLKRGFPRQFMGTPWVKLTRNSAGQVTDASSLMPAIDDLDPFNPQYGVTLTLIPQVLSELE